MAEQKVPTSAATTGYTALLEAADRLARVDDGEPIGSVYPDSNGGECSTTVTDTEMLADAWINEHVGPVLAQAERIAPTGGGAEAGQNNCGGPRPDGNPVAAELPGAAVTDTRDIAAKYGLTLCESCGEPVERHVGYDHGGLKCILAHDALDMAIMHPNESARADVIGRINQFYAAQEEADTPPPRDPTTAYGSFGEAAEDDTTVATCAQLLENDGSDREQILEQCIVALANQKNALAEKALMLSLLAPRRYRLPDGRELMYRTPDSLVPVTERRDATSATTFAGTGTAIAVVVQLCEVMCTAETFVLTGVEFAMDFCCERWRVPHKAWEPYLTRPDAASTDTDGEGVVYCGWKVRLSDTEMLYIHMDSVLEVT